MPRRRNSVTMRDVADLAGVSKQTVSVVINDKPGITEETTQRVLAAVEELGYRRDLVARSLRTGRTRSVTLVASDTSSPFIGKLAVAAEDYAHASGYSLILHNTHDDAKREAAYFQAAVERAVDGVLFVSATDDSPGLDILRSAGIPFVAVDRTPFPYDDLAVVLDNVEAGRLAAEHLLSLGHTQIAHIGGPLKLYMSRERLKGFSQALEAGGAASGMFVCEAGGWGFAEGHQAMQRVLEDASHCTAVFASSDELAMGAMKAIREAGLRVPQDISILGVDDIDAAAYACPPLTTIRQSITELAVLGLRFLFDVLDGKEPDQNKIIMAPELVVRESTTSPRD